MPTSSRSCARAHLFTTLAAIRPLGRLAALEPRMRLAMLDWRLWRRRPNGATMIAVALRPEGP